MIGCPGCDVDGLFAHLFPCQNKVLPVDFLVLLAVWIVDIEFIGVVSDYHNAVHDVADVDGTCRCLPFFQFIIGQEAGCSDDPNGIAPVQGSNDRIKILSADILHASGWDVVGCQGRDGAMIDAKTVISPGNIPDKTLIRIALQSVFIIDGHNWELVSEFVFCDG